MRAAYAPALGPSALVSHAFRMLGQRYQSLEVLPGEALAHSTDCPISPGL